MWASVVGACGAVRSAAAPGGMPVRRLAPRMLQLSTDAPKTGSTGAAKPVRAKKKPRGQNGSKKEKGAAVTATAALTGKPGPVVNPGRSSRGGGAARGGSGKASGNGNGSKSGAASDAARDAGLVGGGAKSKGKMSSSHSNSSSSSPSSPSLPFGSSRRSRDMGRGGTPETTTTAREKLYASKTPAKQWDERLTRLRCVAARAPTLPPTCAPTPPT
jgi:hypothetical protein